MILFVFSCVPIYHEQSCLPFSVLNINLLWFLCCRIREELGMLLQCIESFRESFQNFPENGKSTTFIHGIKFLSTFSLGKSPDGEKLNLSSSVTGYSVVQISFIKTVEQPKSETWSFLAINSWILDTSYGNKLKDYKLLFSAVGEKKIKIATWNETVEFALNCVRISANWKWTISGIKLHNGELNEFLLKTPLMRANRQSYFKTGVAICIANLSEWEMISEEIYVNSRQR